MLKSALTTFFLCCAGLIQAAQDGVTVQLRSCRTEYRTHDNSIAPGLICTLELIPPSGTFMCESASLTGIIRVKDAIGTTRIADRRSVEIRDNNRAYTTFSISQRPTGSNIEIEGELLVTVAQTRTAHSVRAISLIEKSELNIGKDENIRLIPAQANNASHNREGTKIRCAGLELISPKEITIRRVERVWRGMSNEEYSQPVELNQTGKSTYEIELWDANPTEYLRVVTVKKPRREKVNFRLNVSLGEVKSK